MEFPNINQNWDMVVNRQVACHDDTDAFESLEGRAVCFIHLAATPLKAISGLGRLILAIVEIATIIFAVITLNAHPNRLFQAGANVFDVGIGVVLLPIGLFTQAVRALLGTVISPDYMINYQEIPSYATQHNILQGTLVNYGY